MENDIQAVIGLIERSIYVRIAEVMSGAGVEGDSRLTGKTDDARRAQVGWRWKESSRQLALRAVTYGPASVSNECILPYRRRQHLGMHHDSLTRFVEVIDRLRVPLMEMLVSDELDALCETAGGRDLGRSLLLALVTYDLPTVATLAEQHSTVRQGLSDVLRVTRTELSAIEDIDRSVWDHLADGEYGFTRFDPTYQSR